MKKSGGGASSCSTSTKSACGDGNGDGPGPSKHPRTCIIHGTNEYSNLSSLRDIASWKTLLNAPKIHQHQPLLAIASNLPEDQYPNVAYHHKCRNDFIHKRALDELRNKKVPLLSQNKQVIGSPIGNQALYLNNQLGCMKKKCIFCPGNKYVKGTNSKEPVTQCAELRCDDVIRKVAQKKQDTKVLALASRDLVAAEAHYHRSCYPKYVMMNLTNLMTWTNEP